MDGCEAGDDDSLRTLHGRLTAVLAGRLEPESLRPSEAIDVRDELLALSVVHDLHLAPLSEVGHAARWQHHPAVAALKHRLEEQFLWRLALDTPPAPVPYGPDETVAQIRALAHDDVVPEVYDWLAEKAGPDSVRQFLELEGGPDAGFDDLVALCQLGLRGEPKLELARNYWDEMGRGALDEIHTELHAQLSRAMHLAPPKPSEQPVPVLERGLLNGVLATNRYLQPELVGALGLIELQAGPRCRRVVRALERIGAPARALPFYLEHAKTDPWHGKAWLDHVITPLVGDPCWAEGIIRGARWRSLLNSRFFATVGRELLAA